jgi:GNAT superfamily N-acetyltransferase
VPAPGWAVRAASGRDSRALAALRWAWRVTELGEAGMGRAEFDAAFAEWHRVHASTHLAWVAEDGTATVGMAWLATIERVPGPAAWTRLAGHLQSVYVLPAHRNAGVGAALVTAALEDASARGLGYVIVHPSERSFPFYRRLGFGETGRLLELRHGEARPAG